MMRGCDCVVAGCVDGGDLNHPPRLAQLCEGDEALAAGVTAYVASRNPAALRATCEAQQGAVEVQVDGRQLRLVAGEHFVWNAAGLLAV